MQQPQSEWLEQWQIFADDEHFLFADWIRPLTLADFRGQDVLEAGCGGGQHTRLLAPYARTITAVDLNTGPLARERFHDLPNVTLVEGDIASSDLGRKFDVVMSIGVVHHTDSPERTVANLKRHLKPGGRLILWVYSREGNALVRLLVEPIRKLFLRHLPRRCLVIIAQLLTALLYLPIYTVYRLPLTFLPYHAYFQNFRRLSFRRNVLNVFDKLNAPQVDFISRERAEAMVADLADPLVLPYRGVSYSISGKRHS